MTIFYFTATGNSLAVAKQIGGTLLSVPQVIESDNQRYKDDVIGIVFPLHWWSPPIMVRRFMEKAHFEAEYIFAIGTYGSIVAGAMASLKKYADKNGYRFDYINQVQMLDNYIPVFDMSAQEKKLPKKRVAENIEKIVTDIKNRKRKNTPSYPWSLVMTAYMRSKFKPEKDAQGYIVDDKCNACGVCSQVCPANNIVVTDKVGFGNQCEGCFACLHLCPQNALHMKNEKSDKRWRNPSVSLNEIIKTNNRTVRNEQ